MDSHSTKTCMVTVKNTLSHDKIIPSIVNPSSGNPTFLPVLSTRGVFRCRPGCCRRDLFKSCSHGGIYMLQAQAFYTQTPSQAHSMGFTRFAVSPLCPREDARLHLISQIVLFSPVLPHFPVQLSRTRSLKPAVVAQETGHFAIRRQTRGHITPPAAISRVCTTLTGVEWMDPNEPGHLSIHMSCYC